MAEISKITLPSGTTYDIKDTVAREMASGVIHLLEGINETPLSDGATTNPITIDGESYTAVKGDATFWENKEFVYDGAVWHEFGDLTGLKALAYKDTASTTYTPSGSVSQPIFSGDSLASTGVFTPVGNISSQDNESGNYTPTGAVSTPLISVSEAGATTTVNSITDVGTLPTLTTTVENENLTISFNRGTLPTKGENTTVKTGDASYVSSTPSFTGTKVQLDFTGTQGNLNVTGTPTGAVSTPTFTGDTATITVS